MLRKRKALPQMQTHIRTRLKSCREALKMTQVTLGEHTGLSPSLISLYESGTILPSVDTLCRLAVALHTSTDYLCGLSENSATAYHDENAIGEKP